MDHQPQQPQQELPDINTEFLSSVLGQKVTSFTVKPGSNVGDNYMSVLYTFTVELEEPNKDGEKTLTLLSKCFPSHPTRQQFLKMSNVFYNELKVYDTFLPALGEMAINNRIKEKLPFSPLVGGTAVDFLTAKKNGDTSYEAKIYGAFDNYLMMPDLRTYGYRMADRQVGLDLEHTKLVMKAYAKLHSLSWAYKLQNDLESIEKKFPFMEFEMSDTDVAMFTNVLQSTVGTAMEVMEPTSNIYERTKTFQGKMADLMEISFKKGQNYADMGKFHRVTPDLPNGQDWKVVVHGDCWVNNMLFHYNDVNHPTELILIDLQMLREACPTSDLVYVLYSSTARALRDKHLDELLELYHDEFLSHCKTLGVEPLVNFSLEELKRRFHISKILGYCLALMVIPIMLKDASEVKDLEKMDKNSGMDDMFTTLAEKAGNNSKYRERVLALAEELYEQGVL